MSNSPAGTIRLFVLGDARIETPSAVLEPTASVTFAAALYLILERFTPVSRSVFAELLWAPCNREVANHRLRQTLLKLRRLGIPVRSVGKTKLDLRDAEVWVDYEQLDVSGNVPDGTATNHLTILPGYSLGISAEYSAWFDGRKSVIVAMLTREKLSLIAHHRLAGEWGSLEESASSLLELCPLNEEATLALAESYAMRGSKHAATKLLDNYLTEVGEGPTDLRLQATLMRRRIADRVAPRSPGAGAPSPLVGRSGTMMELGEQLRLAKSGRGQASLIVGEAGIGKSRVLSELSQFAALQGLLTQRIQCRPSHKQRPLSAFVELAPVLCALPGALGCSPDTLSFLDRLTKHQPKRSTKPSYVGEPGWVFNGVQRALFDLIDAVADEHSLLIQMEDIHWLDDASAEVMREMIPWAVERRVFFALTGREPPEEWQDGLPNGLRVMDLSPLTPEQSAELVLNTVRQHGRHIEAAYLTWCVRVAEGNPYFLHELATHWIETGAEHAVPPSLSAVLTKRVARLNIGALQVLQTCALLENNSTLPRIEAVLQHDAHALLRNIDSLGSAGMIVVDAVDALGSRADLVGSKHELLSNVALMHLSAPARRFLHRRIGQVLEQEIDEQFSAATLWDCAKHWQLAGDNQRARQLATSCASHLMEVGLPTAAAAAYTKCLSFCSTDEQRLEILSAQTLAYYRMSAWANVRDSASAVRTLQERLDPTPTRHDDIELMDLRAEWQSLQWDVVLTKALTCLEASDAPAAHRADAGVMALMLLGFQGDMPAIKRAYQSIERLAASGDVREATKLQAKMVFHTNFGELVKAVAAAQDLVIEQITHGDVGDLFRAHCNAAVTFRVAGLFTEAEASFVEALRIAETHSLNAAQERALPLVANMAIEIGNTEQARLWYETLCRIKLDPANRYSFLERQAIGARLALHDGRGTDAQALLPMTYVEACQDPIHHRRTYNLALHVAVELATKGEATPEALTNLEEAFSRSRRGLHQAYGAYVLYEALLRGGFRTKARKILAEYRTTSRREPWPAPEHLLLTLKKGRPVS